METPREASSHDDSATDGTLDPAPPPATSSQSDLSLAAARPGAGLILSDLKRFGPDASPAAMGLDEAFGYCKRLAQSHYENFSVTNHWIPRRLRPHFHSVYAYCRWSDDLADEMDSTQTASAMLEWWQDQLDACYCGRARHPVFIALRHTISQFQIPKSPFEDLLSAFIQDQTVTRYPTQHAVLDYCRRSANPVGRLVLYLANTHSDQNARWSDAICSGLQIANFCQDVAVDARRGRIYWPLEFLDQAAIEPADLLRGEFQPQWQDALATWASTAVALLCEGAPLVEQGPRWFARSVQLFARGGLTILDNLAAHQFDVWNQSITVRSSQKLKLVWDACLRARSTHWSRRSLDFSAVQTSTPSPSAAAVQERQLA